MAKTVVAFLASVEEYKDHPAKSAFHEDASQHSEVLRKHAVSTRICSWLCSHASHICPTLLTTPDNS